MLENETTLILRSVTSQEGYKCKTQQRIKKETTFIISCIFAPLTAEVATFSYLNLTILVTTAELIYQP
jgi:hypothetical protein